jgi:hypothetical protein
MHRIYLLAEQLLILEGLSFMELIMRYTQTDPSYSYSYGEVSFYALQRIPSMDNIRVR